jgi:cytoskeletal protein RodZ
MSDFGDRLKAAREERGVSLRQIATSTKISMSALEALERGDLSRLPGGIFSRAFVRAYAGEVGLDPEEAVKGFLIEFESTARKAADSTPPEVTADDREFLERQRRAASVLRAVLVGFVVLLLTAVVYWQVRSAGPLPVVEPGPRSEGAPAGTPRASAAATSTSLAAEDGALLVAIDVSAPCWMQINADKATEPIVSRVLNSGEHHEFRAEHELVLQVGSAGVVKWSINGHVAKPLGRVGERVRVSVTHANLKDYLQ